MFHLKRFLCLCDDVYNHFSTANIPLMVTATPAATVLEVLAEIYFHGISESCVQEALLPPLQK